MPANCRINYFFNKRERLEDEDRNANASNRHDRGWPEAVSATTCAGVPVLRSFSISPPNVIPSLPSSCSPSSFTEPSFPMSTVDASPVPAHELGTFVVQVAKDQIYRVPPPENAYLVERYRKRSKSRRRSPCFRCLIWILVAALLFLLILATAAAALCFVLRPASLAFAVQSLSVRSTTDPNKTEYDLTLSVRNPSHKMGYSYAAGGSVVLVAVTNGSEIAAGETPGFYQGPRNTTTMPLVLRGSNASQPKVAAALKLTAKLRARPKVGKLKLGSMRMEVTCVVGASALSGEARILSQHCNTKLRL